MSGFESPCRSTIGGRDWASPTGAAEGPNSVGYSAGAANGWPGDRLGESPIRETEKSRMADSVRFLGSPPAGRRRLEKPIMSAPQANRERPPGGSPDPHGRS